MSAASHAGQRVAAAAHTRGNTAGSRHRALRWLRYAALYLAVLILAFQLAACGQKAGSLRLDGIRLLQEGRYPEAIDKLNEALQAGNGRVGKLQLDILMYRAEAEYMNGDTEAALKTCELLEQADGEKALYTELKQRVQARLTLAQAQEALNQDRLEEASELLDRANEQGLAQDQAYLFDSAVLLEKQGKWQEAYAAFDRYLKQYPQDMEAKKEYNFLKSRIEQ